MNLNKNTLGGMLIALNKEETMSLFSTFGFLYKGINTGLRWATHKLKRRWVA